MYKAKKICATCLEGRTLMSKHNILTFQQDYRHTYIILFGVSFSFGIKELSGCFNFKNLTSAKYLKFIKYFLKTPTIPNCTSY